MLRCTFIFWFLFSLLFAKAQVNAGASTCSSPGSLQFDFWLGDWELTWNDTSKGTNTIRRILDGCVVQENFSDPANNFTGMSWSMYNVQSQTWQQTWVDNQGGYIVLTGKFDNKQMILSTRPILNAQGKQSVSRMIFSNIQADSFEWNWENSTDNGKTWKLNWKIYYKRKK